MAGIPTSNILQPGNISIVGGATRGLVSQLQLLKPQFYNKYTEKYGNEDFTWFLSTYAGMEKVENRNFFWFENRGKLMVAITNLTQVTTPAAGAIVTVTIPSGDHFNSGTQSPLRVGETVRVASSNIEGVILTINTTTANANSCTISPKQITQAFISAGSTSLLANEILLFGGDMDAGEASGSVEPLIHLDQQYSNNITEMRDSWSATDLAEMTQVYYDGGFSGEAMAGGGQAGTSMFTLKGLYKTNQRYKNSVEAKLMRGDVVSNTNLLTTTSVGTQGFISKVTADGETVGYTPGTLDIAKFHEITRIMDVNGCAKDNLWLADIYQRQQFSDGIFKEFPAGAYLWGKNEKSEEAAVAYGVQSFMLDEYMFKVKKYKPFNTEYTTGKTPGTDYFRNYGIICPQGETRDARTGNAMKNVQVMYQEPVGGGTVGNGIRVWQHGGASLNPTSGTLKDNVEMVCYRALRVTAANQFLIIQAA